MKLNQKYTIPILIIIIILTIMVVVSIKYLEYTQKITDDNTLQNLGELAKQDATKIQNQIEQHKKILENIVEQIEKQDNITEQNIFDIYEDNIAKEEFSRIAVMYEDGTTVTSDGEIVDLSEEKEEFFSSDDILISKSRKSKVDQEEINIYSKKLNVNGNNIVVMLVVETSKYEKIFAQSIYNGNGYEYIINSEGEIIANSKKRENGYNLFSILETLNDEYNTKQLEKMKSQISNRENGEVKYDVSWKYYYTSYKYLGVNDWYLLIITPGSLIAQEYNKSLMITVIFSILVNLVVLIIGIYIVVSNKRKKEKLYQLAYVDQLTGIGNSNYFIEKGTEILKTTDYNNILIIVDVDKFKTFNKKYGRETGDLLLKEISSKLNKIFNKNGIVTRLANDIFAILIKDRKEMEKTITKIDKELSNLLIDKNEYKVIISIGIYKVQNIKETIYEALDKALIAHKMAKGNYNKKYYIFNETIEEKMIKEHDIESKMEDGIKNQEFKVYYQPKVNSKTGKIEEAEALVRWEMDGKLIPPNEFIPIFEKNKFIIELDEYIYEKVCEDISEWNKKYNRKIKVSVNISKEHLLESFIDKYKTIASKYNLLPSDIELEITESAAISEDFDMLKILGEIKNAGFSISIDDFGTGYSSLNMLKDMPIDVIKIDKSFIEQDQMIEIIVGIAKEMNLKTVAEGVETKTQVDKLRDFGVDLLQGYYYSKPLKKSDFEKYWQNN